MTDQARDQRYKEMHDYEVRQDRRGCLQGGPYHPNQYFHQECGYWICPDCGDTSRKRSLKMLGGVVLCVLVSFVMLFILFALGVLR